MMLPITAEQLNSSGPAAYVFNAAQLYAEAYHSRYYAFSRRSDLVMKAQMEGHPIAVHIEFQSGNDKNMRYRILVVTFD